MKLFDLEEALSGKPVVLRSGQKAFVEAKCRESIRHKVDGYSVLLGYEEDGDSCLIKMSWSENGRYEEDVSHWDIVGMWEEPLMFEYGNLINPRIKYFAKDSTGFWYAYENKPSLVEGCWSGGLKTRILGTALLNRNLFPECDWQSSLIKRPEESRANAKLIAAAPKLVDALQEMAAQHYCGCGHPACNECKRDKMCAEALHKAGVNAPEDWR